MARYMVIIPAHYKYSIMSGTLQKREQDRLQEAEYFMHHGDVEAALISYSKAIFLSPKKASLFARKAEAYVRLGDYHSAVFNYRRALKLVQGQHQKWKARLSQLLHVSGRLKMDQGQFQQAVSLVKLFWEKGEAVYNESFNVHCTLPTEGVSTLAIHVCETSNQK